MSKANKELVVVKMDSKAYCPRCDDEILGMDKVHFSKLKFCSYCGQALDWYISGFSSTTGICIDEISSCMESIENPYGAYVREYANNHGMPMEEAYLEPACKAFFKNYVNQNKLGGI